jgi:hypothetical protein
VPGAIVVAMKKLATITALAAVAVPAAAPAAAPAREVEGTVVAVNRDARTFTLRDEGVRVRVRVNRSTRYEDLTGFSAVRVGRRDIEAIVHRANGRWVATLVERSGRSRDDD